MNKWATVNRVHINTDQVRSFSWGMGMLWIFFAGQLEPVGYEDPDRENYLDLCRHLLLTPKEGSYGKN